MLKLEQARHYELLLYNHSPVQSDTCVKVWWEWVERSAKYTCIVDEDIDPTRKLLLKRCCCLL